MSTNAAIPAAGRDDHCGPRGLVRRGKKGRDGGFTDTGDDVVAGWLGDADGFVVGVAFRAGCAIGPEQNLGPHAVATNSERQQNQGPRQDSN